ncbi:MAG: acetylornithine/succinylornithine family transaminase [Clostridia bacterium]|nr:acetylornithine/succinylornithine family transaminase [Clostridia bacterium]
MNEMSGLKQRDKTYIANTYSRFDVEIVSGKGSVVYDANGKRYIDMGSGIGVTCFGIADDVWVKAVTEQLDKVQHTSNLYYTEPCVELAELLCNASGMKKVFFGNSGAEANECAIKVARKYAAEKKGRDCFNIITLENSFHGRTVTTLAATGQDVFHKDFQPLTQGFLHSPANDLDAMKKLVAENKIAAIMIECVQGEGGVNPLTPEFVKGVYDLAQAQDILLIVDEVQTGNGRTGEMYAYQNYGITPDIVSTAKGLGGGLPLGATLLGEKTEFVLGYGDHGSTYGGNPIACAGAVSVIGRMNKEFLDSVKAKSKLVFETLADSKGIELVSGMGLMIGIKTEKPAKEIVIKCMERGVLCLTAKDKVRLLPALNINEATLTEALEIIKSVCAE